MIAIEAFQEYLQRINITAVAQERITRVLTFLDDLLAQDESVNRIFISEFVDSEGSRNLENLWMFTEKFTYEAKNFLSEIHFDCTILAGNVTYWDLATSDFYPLHPAKPSSRVNLNVTFVGGSIGALTGALKASGDNCPYLYDVLKKVISPNRAISPGAHLMT
jgi:hypothetical protein